MHRVAQTCKGWLGDSGLNKKGEFSTGFTTLENSEIVLSFKNVFFQEIHTICDQ